MADLPDGPLPDDGQEYGLVMPFVVCRSVGGPFDDDAFVAGYECGLLDEKLERKPGSIKQTMRTDNVPQADLIALKHGYVMDAQDTRVEGWSVVTIRLPEDDLGTEPGDV